MRKIVLAGVGAVALLAGGIGLAMAQSGAPAPAAAQPERAHMFEADANSDGVLTRAEFDNGRSAAFTRLDADRNGQLTREEMRAGRGERGDRGRRGGRGMHDMTRADVNNDGNITRDEFLSRPTEMFNRLDANRDGVISAAERPQRREGANARTPRADRPNPDADGNGTFSQAEFTAMGARMFERLDANSDGRVTQEEAQAGRHGRRGHH